MKIKNKRISTALALDQLRKWKEQVVSDNTLPKDPYTEVNRSTTTSNVDDYNSDGTKSTKRSTLGHIWEDIKNTGRLWTKKFIEQEIDQDYADMQKRGEEIDDINKILRYKDLHMQLKQLQNSFMPSIVNENRIKQIQSEINQLDEYFKGPGRTHDVIASNMYDADKMSAWDKAYVNTQYITRGTDLPDFEFTPQGIANYFTRGAVNTLKTAELALEWAARAAGRQIDSLFGRDTSSGYMTKQVVKSRDENDPVANLFLNSIYKGSDVNVSDIENSIDDKYLKNQISNSNREIKEIAVNQNAHRQFAKDGKIFGIDIYDPEDIPQQFINEQEEFGNKSLFKYIMHPYDALRFSIPETASTVALYKHQIAPMTINALSSYIIQNAPVWAIKGLGTVAGKIAESFASGFGKTALGAASIGSSIYGAAASRKDETALEAILGMAERVSEKMQTNGGNVKQVIDAVEDYSKSIGLDTSGFKLDDYIKTAIAYGIQTGDPVFDSERVAARNSITKLINSNNALAVVDYLQALPFMEYSGKAIKSWAQNMLGAGTKPLRGYLPKSAVAEASKGIMQSVSDATIGRAAKKWISDGAVKRGLYTKRIGDYLLNKVPLALGEGISEGLEEANQEILQDRYKRGAFDDYAGLENMFSINEVFDIPNLATDAITAYFGINPEFSEDAVNNIRKAFHIGFASSMLFSGGMRALSNVLPGDNDNMRNLVALMKNDKYLSNIVADYYDKALDQRHLELFYDAFTKAGVNGVRMNRSLNDVLNSVDENNTLVRKDYVKSDIMLAENLWNAMNSEKLNKLLKDHKVDKTSEDYKNIMIDAASIVTKYQKLQEGANDALISQHEMSHAHEDVVSEMVSDDTSEERLQLLEELYPELSRMVKQWSTDYTDYKQSREASKRGKYGSFVKSISSLLKFSEDTGVLDYVEKYVTPNSTVPTDIDLKNMWYNASERKKALKHAYEYHNRSDYNELLLDFNSFFRNKYIRQYARKRAGLERNLNRELAKIYQNEDLRKLAIQSAYESYDNGTYSLQDYVIERLHLFHNYMQLEQAQKLQNILSDKDSRHKELRRVTGLDVYDGLEGMVDALNTIVEQLKKSEDAMLNGKNSNRNQKLTYADFFKDKEFKFDDNDDYLKSINAYALNLAVLKPTMTVASAYLSGNGSPISLHDAVFGAKSKDDALSDILQQYGDLQAQEDAANNGDAAAILGAKDRKNKSKQLGSNAAWGVIKKRLDEKLKRERIANREFRDEGPITPAQQEREQVEQANLDDNTASNLPQAEAPLSDSEKRLNLKYNRQKGELKTLQERIEEQRERRKNAVVDDVIPLPEESDDNDSAIIGGEEATMELDDGEQPVDISEEQPVGTSTEEEQAGPNQDENAKEGAEENTEDEVEIEENTEDEFEDSESDDTDLQPGTSEDEDIINDVDESIDFDVQDDTEQDVANAEAAAEAAEEENDANDVILSDGWINIEDYSDLLPNDQGFLEYRGQVLPEDQQKVVMDDLILLGLTETSSFSQEDLPDGDKLPGLDLRDIRTNDGLLDLVSQTFFYQPNPQIDKETGESELPKITVNGEQVKLDKPLASGDKLSKKLSTPGWLATTKKYFIVAQSELGKNVDKGMDPRDAMTVVLIIEDDKNSYATFLRALGTTSSEIKSSGDKVTVNKETELRNWLQSRNVQWSKVIEALDDDKYSIRDGKIYIRGGKYALSSSQKVDLYRQALSKLSMERARQQYFANTGTYDGYEHWWLSDPIRSDFPSDESWNTAVAERKRTRKLIQDRVRQTLVMPGKTLLSDEGIDKLISNLRNYRNSIIDAYLTKTKNKDQVVYNFPKTVNKSVVPVQVKLSNGKITKNTDRFKNPIYRTIGNGETSIEDIQRSLDTGDITIGYGLGMFAHRDDRWKIMPIRRNASSTPFHGRGLSGKLYWMVKSINGSDLRIPVMLAEEKFDTQIRVVGNELKTVYLNNPDNLVLCLHRNPATGKLENTNTQGYLPSAAEVIFYMLTGLINVGLDAERHAEMVEFFIHSGDKTLLKNQPKSGRDPFNFLASKQLSLHVENNERVLTVGIKDKSGGYVAKDYKTSELFLQTEEAEQQRREIIQAIATQMHWNTDISHMDSFINILGTSNSSVSLMFRWAIENFAKDYDNVDDYLNQRVSIFGCPQLSFTIGDFFTKSGEELHNKTNVSILAWMIKEQKIKTNTNTNIFEDPFVFANGVKVEGGEVELGTAALANAAAGESSELVINITEPKQNKPKKQGRTKPETKADFLLFDQQAYNEMVSEWRSGLEDRRRREGWFVAQTEEERNAVRASIDQTKGAKDNGGINDRIMIRAPKTKISGDKAVDEFKIILKQFLDKYNKQYPDKQVNIDDVTINDLAKDQLKDLWGYKRGYVLLDLYKNGKAKIQVRKDSDFENWKNPVTGIFSTSIGGKGTLDIDKARKWLSDTLGIDKDNIFVGDAIMRSTTNEAVYGLTNVVTDRIVGEVTGYMRFSSQADSGIEYHEAWHYVNLLMHDQKTRRQIYESYLKTHKNVTDVEEAMADDFKVFMEGFTDSSLTGKVKRFFRNILDLLIATRDKKSYRIVYKAIAEGKYAGKRLDAQSVAEFLKRYSRGVAQVLHYIPGISKKELQSMPHVNRYQDIFDGTDAILNRVFATIDLSSIKKMNEIATGGFNKILQIVDDMIDEQTDENKIEKLQDIRKSESLLRKALIDRFLDFGVIAKVRKVSDVKTKAEEDNDDDPLKKEDDPTNTWDKFHLTAQRKENASLATKMFMSQIPIRIKQYDEEGNVFYSYDRDDYGTIKLYDKDQAWRTIIDELWACDSFSERDDDGNLSPTSIMGIIESKRNVNEFFYSLYEKLQQLDDVGEYGDILLKSQIFTAVNSSKNQVQLVIINDPVVSKSYSIDEMFADFGEDSFSDFDSNDVVADRKREWLLRNDSLISVAKNIPRTWSKNLASNGLLDFNRKENKSSINGGFVTARTKEFEKIQNTISKYTTSKKKGAIQYSDEKLQSVLDSLKPKIIEFYTQFGIECDKQSLNVYIALISEINGELTPQQLIDTLDKIFNTTKVGSIGYVLEGLSLNIGNSEATHAGSEYKKAIDEVFNNYAADSHIGILAVAWSAVHPSRQEFSAQDGEGNRLYPVNLNNYLSDRVLAMNNRRSGYIQKMRKSKYCEHSILLNAAENSTASNPKSKIKLNTFVGIRDANRAVGANYFGITAAEDYIAKLLMTEDDLLIFPTTADKPSWYSVSSSGIKLTHDAMLAYIPSSYVQDYIYLEYEKISPYDDSKYTSKSSWNSEAKRWYNNLDESDATKIAIKKSAISKLNTTRLDYLIGFDLDPHSDSEIIPRFSKTTLDRFANYFLDEINTLIDYYNKDVIRKIVRDKNAAIENYHGKVKNGRMDFSGNGGKFRYFYDIPLPGLKNNLNHLLEGLFELQKKIEAGLVIDRNALEGDIAPYIGVGVLGGGLLDGFELIRLYLLNLKKTYFNNAGFAKPALLSAINYKLVDLTESELYRISRPDSPIRLAEYNKTTHSYIPTAIPEKLLDRYTKQLQESGYGSYENTYDNDQLQAHALFSLIGSYVANSVTSIIEVEKVFTGDPAWYKKKSLKKIQRFANFSKLPKQGKGGVIYVTSDNENAYEFSDGSYVKIDPAKEPSIESINLQLDLKDGSQVIEQIIVENLHDTFSDKIKRIGGALSPGLELRELSDEELNFDPTLKSWKYTNLNMEDIEIPSRFLDEIEDIFKRQLVVDIIRSGENDGFNVLFAQLQEERNQKNEKLKSLGKKERKPLTKELVIDMIYSNKQVFDRMFNLLTDSEREAVDSNLKQQMKPYKNITVADALVFIRPALYRKIRIRLGLWSLEPDETGYSDEDAYNILEGITVNEDGTRTKLDNPSTDWTSDKNLYKKVQKLSLFPLKMSYFQNDTEEITKDVSINRPIYNKMAIFPLFAFQRSTNVGDMLYQRMNKPGHELDMLSFKSAVKVGGVKNGADVLDPKSTETALSDISEIINSDSNVRIDYTTDEVIPNNSDNTLAVTVQDLHNLRLLQNTEAHSADVRNIGTQMFKIAFSNIIDDALYGTEKSDRNPRSGSKIKHDIMNCINALTIIGADDIRDRFYTDGHINDDEVRRFVETIVRNNGLGSAAEDIIANGGVAAGLLSRRVFENSATVVVNSSVVDIPTKGGSAIQQSVFGFAGYDNKNVGTLSYNSGRELEWSAEEGSMQVILSMNFFKSVVPDYDKKTHEERRNWLIEHNVIGDNAKPFGIGYRIPTQGMSSMFAFQVVDVVPEQVADLIIVPREFTAQTGSDFDVDKIYLATFSYKDGVLESLSDKEFYDRKISAEHAFDIAEDRQLANGAEIDEVDVIKWIQDASDITKEDVRGAIANRLLLNYIDIITDRRNYANSRASIDTITNKIHDELLNPILKAKPNGYIGGFSELTPSFLAIKKMEFGVGKSGIGPFALNITNLALTQYSHLTIDFGEVGKEYGFGALDKIYGRDKLRISDWLSAMVNAHVDVAKDPYVFDINVNNQTYNHANLLLRCGMGISTFIFLAQPSLKQFASILNNSGGIYGNNIDGSLPDTQALSTRKKAVYRNQLKYFTSILNNFLSLYKDMLNKEDIDYANAVISYYKYLTTPVKDRKDAGYDDKNKPKRPVSRKDIFSESIGKSAILNYNEFLNRNINEDNVVDILDSIIFQLASLEAFNEIDDFAQLLSSLVTRSGIDTKKFGNEIYQHIDFKNKYNELIYDNSYFTINTPEFLEWVKELKSGKNDRVDKNTISRKALDMYFGDTYLSRKLNISTGYIKQILSRLLFTATDVYESLFKNILGIVGLRKTYKDMEDNLIEGYGNEIPKKSIEVFAHGIDSILRFYAFMNAGSEIYKKESKRNGKITMIDFTMGGNIDNVRLKFKELMFGSDLLSSIFARTAKFIKQIKKDPFSEIADGLVDSEGNITNDLLRFLNPQTPNEKYPIGRMLLYHSQTESTSSEESRLISAFAQLLGHPNEQVRELATDLAFYAYFSNYDNNTSNSFFNVVPYEYRKLYDEALKVTLSMLSSKKKEVNDIATGYISGLYNNSDIRSYDESKIALDIIDVLSRNYWYNDNLVPVYYPKNNNPSTALLNTYGEFTGVSIYDQESGRTFPTYIASTGVKNNSVYIKVRKGSGVFLYRRVGEIKRTYEDGKDIKNASSYAIYVAIPKAGFRQKGVSQLELFSSYGDLSIFEQNKLSVDYAEDVIRKEIEKLVSESNDSNDKNYNLLVVWDSENVLPAYVHTNYESYIPDYTIEPTKRNINGITVYSKKNPEYVGQKKADVIIDFTNKRTTAENVERPNVVKDYKDKVVELSFNSDLDSVVAEINKIKNKDVIIHLTTSLFDGKFDVTEEQIEDFVLEQLAKYKSMLSNDVDIESLVKSKEDSIRNSKRLLRDVAQERINDLIHNLILRLAASGSKILGITAAANDGKTQMAVSISYVKQVDYSYLDGDKNKVYANKEFTLKRKRFFNFLNRLDYTPVQPEQTVEESSVVRVPVEEVQTVQEKVLKIVSKSKFAVGLSEDEFDAAGNAGQQEDPMPEILKEALDKEQNKDESNNQQCGTSRRSKFSRGMNDINEEL